MLTDLEQSGKYEVQQSKKDPIGKAPGTHDLGLPPNDSLPIKLWLRHCFGTNFPLSRESFSIRTHRNKRPFLAFAQQQKISIYQVIKMSRISDSNYSNSQDSESRYSMTQYSDSQCSINQYTETHTQYSGAKASNYQFSNSQYSAPQKSIQDSAGSSGKGYNVTKSGTNSQVCVLNTSTRRDTGRKI